MPNHIRTKIRPDKDYEKIASVVLSDKEPKEGEDTGQYFDFKKVIPPPENIEEGGCSGNHAEGVICWYEWQTANWDTKWGAYDFDPDGKYEKEFSFQTAWSQPAPVIEQLSKMFPDVEFDVKYADEDIGNNLGHYKIKNGEKTWEHEFKGYVSVEDEKELFARRIRH